MAQITVTPEAFTFVEYDHGEILAAASALADKLGVGDAAVEIEIDEKTPLGRTRLDSLDPIRLFIEGGAIEDATNPRHLSQRGMAEVIGRLLLRAVDRRSGGFGDAPEDTDLSLQQLTAWDSYCLGRLARLGYDTRQPRRRYHFRNRHGFNDVADRTFDRLWGGENLTWADIEDACAETAAVTEGATA